MEPTADLSGPAPGLIHPSPTLLQPLVCAAMIEIMRFRLLPDADVDAFLVADSRVQSDFAYRQPGLVRRTTANDRDGNWIVIDLWQSGQAAKAADERWGRDPVTTEFMSFVDSSSVTTERYAEVD